MLMDRVTALIAKVDGDEVLAVAYPRLAAIDAVSEQDPESTKVIAPEDEFTVHTDVVEELYVIVPAPSLGVARAVGLVPTSNAYEALKAPPVSASDKVRVAAVMVKDSSAAVAAE
jgi:hypothetical protein